MMPSPTRFLRSPAQISAPDAAPVDSDLIVILVSLLCAMICVVGLVLIARCARPLPSSVASSSASGGASSSTVSARLLPRAAASDRGLKKKLLRALPMLSFEAEAGGGFTECPICLAEFAEHDKIRVLPHCGHCFHVSCIDTWLDTHSSCPSCRRSLAVPAPAPTAAGVLGGSRT